MSNLETENPGLKENEKKILLQEFEQVAYDLKKSSVLREIITYNLRGWISSKLTVLMQDLGYNHLQLRNFKEQRLILNIGCLEITNNSYVNADLVPDIGQFIKILTGKYKIEHNLFINLISYDKHLSGVADGIILSHVLEHINSMLAITALKNSFAYLKSGGSIRVSVPYLGAYEQPNFPDCQKVGNRMLAKNKLIYDYGHQFMYDAELLTLLMEEAGFKEVKEVSFGKGILGETDLPHRKPESIYLTGVKRD